MNPYTRAHVVVPDGISEPVRNVLIRNIEMLYKGELRGNPAQGRYIISTNGQWELEIETKLRTGIEYQGRLSIHCFSPETPETLGEPPRRTFTRRTHHWH
jgi:hypothetical protein